MINLTLKSSVLTALLLVQTRGELVRFGTSAPPSDIGGFELEDFPYDGRATYHYYSTVATGVDSDITFSRALEHRRTPNGGWSTWGHGYYGDVYYESATELTISLPPMCAFVFYLEQNKFGNFTFRVELDNGEFVDEFISAEYHTDSAEGFGIYDSGEGMPVSLTITELSGGDADGFGVGEFYGTFENCPVHDSSGNGSDLSGGAIFGIVVAVLVVICVLFYFLQYHFIANKSPATVTSNRNEPAVASGGAPMPTPTISVAPMTAATMEGIRVFPSAAPAAAIGTQPTSMPPAYAKVAAVESATVDVVLQGTAMTVQRDAGTETMPLTFSNASAAAVNLQPAFGDDYYGVGPVGASEYLDAAPSAPPPHYSV